MKSKTLAEALSYDGPIEVDADMVDEDGMPIEYDQLLDPEDVEDDD